MKAKPQPEQSISFFRILARTVVDRFRDGDFCKDESPFAKLAALAGSGVVSQ